MKMKKPKMYGGGMSHKKSKKGYKTGKNVISDKKINRPETKEEILAKGKKQFYIKGPGGKYIPVPIRMVGNKRLATKKGGKV